MLKAFAAPGILFGSAAWKGATHVGAVQLPDVSNWVVMATIAMSALVMLYQKWNAARREEMIKWDQVAGSSLQGKLLTREAQFEELQQSVARLKVEYEKRLTETADRHTERYKKSCEDYEERLKASREESVFLRTRVQALQEQSLASDVNRAHLLDQIQKMSDAIHEHEYLILENKTHIQTVEAKAERIALNPPVPIGPIAVVPAPGSPAFPVEAVVHSDPDAPGGA